MAKDVFTLNELTATSQVMEDLNTWLVEHEGYEEYAVAAVSVVLVDKDKRLIGTFTKWEKNADIQFEPTFVPDLVEVKGE